MEKGASVKPNNDRQRLRTLAYLEESLSEEEAFHFQKFEALERLNILCLQKSLATMESDIAGQKTVG